MLIFIKKYILLFLHLLNIVINLKIITNNLLKIILYKYKELFNVILPFNLNNINKKHFYITQSYSYILILFLLFIKRTKSKNMHTGGIMHTLHSAYFKGFFMHILKKLYAA